MSTAMQDAENHIIVNLETSYGALLIGCFLSCAIWGMSSLQLFWYFYNYDDEPRLRRAFVFILWCLDTAGQVLILMPMWPVLITQWGRVAGLSEVREEMVQHSWIGATLAAAVQMFFLYRIYCFNGRKWVIPVVIGVVALYQPIVTIPYIIVIHENFVYSNLSSSNLKALSISLRAVSAGVDIFTAAAMSYYLLKQGIPKFSSTRKLFMRLFVLTINTGTWTAVIAIVEMILMVARYDTLYYAILEWPLGSFYLSVLLVNLNSRDFVRGTDHTNVWNDASFREVELGNISSRHATSASSSRNFSPHFDGVAVIKSLEADVLSAGDKANPRRE